MKRFLSKGWLVACGAAVGTIAGWGTLNDSKYMPLVPCTKCTMPDDPACVHAVTHSSSPLENSGLNRAIEKSRLIIKRTMLEQGIPGAVVTVCKNGTVVWSEGLGYADVENDVLCTPNTVMRIASISKPLTTVALLQLWQKGLVDLDAPLQKYVPEFPTKRFDGKPVDITTRHLLSNMAGIRHYHKPKKDQGESNNPKKSSISSQREYYITEHFDSVQQSLQLFAKDDLVSEPGKKLNYSTFGWTLVSAVIEKASGEKFLDYMQNHVFRPLGMKATMGEFHEPLMYHRARHYMRDERGYLVNTPYVDISYKWAGGGFVSTAEDLARFGTAMLACYQCCKTTDVRTTEDLKTDFNAAKCELLLEPSTTAMMWKPAAADVISTNLPLNYGMGWFVSQEQLEVVCGKKRPMLVGHTGGAVGATSVLLITPCDSSVPEQDQKVCSVQKVSPRGVVVAVIFNLQDVEHMYSLGVQIAEEFM